MPCPPSWEELEMMRITRARGEADRVIAESAPQLAPALELAAALLAREPGLAKSVPDLATCLAHASELSERGVPVYDGPMPARDGWPSAEDVAREDAIARFRGDVAARLELCLCVLGTFVCVFARDRAIPAELAPAFERERARHLAHREAERRERIAALEVELHRARRAVDTPHPHMGAREHLDGVEARLARMRALDADALCTDRCALD